MTDGLKRELHGQVAFGAPAGIFFIASCLDQGQNLRFDLFELLTAGTAHVEFHLAVCRNGVDGRAAADRTAGKRCSRLFAGMHVGNLGDGAAHSVNRRGVTVILPGMAARAVEMHAVALGASSGAKKSTNINAINRNETVDLHARLQEEMLGTAQIAIAFFANRADETDVADRLNVLFLHRAKHLQDHRQTASIVTDAGRVINSVFLANAHVRSCRKHRIEMRSENQRRAISGTGAARNDVAFLINRDVREAERLKATHQILGALVFMKGRRFHFRNGDLIGKRDFFIAQNRCKGFLDRRAGRQLVGRSRHVRKHRRQLFRIHDHSLQYETNDAQTLAQIDRFCLCRNMSVANPK